MKDLATGFPIAGDGALLSSKAAARLLGIAPATLDAWLCTKRHAIPFFRIGRMIRYRAADLEAFLIAQMKPGAGP